MPPEDVMLNKAATIERCIRRIQEECKADPSFVSPTHVDALILNVERACQAAIDLAMHIVAVEHLGMPQSSAETFKLLEKAGKIDASLARSLKGMTGFRNVVVHEYQEMDLSVLRWIVKEGWKDWVALCRALGLKIDIGTGDS